MNALGLVETIGYVAAIEALDVCLKSASVEVVGIQKVGQGIVTIEVSGDVGAVKSAVEAAKYAAEKVGILRATHVIPRLHADVHDALFKKEDIKSVEEETVHEIEEKEIETEVEIKEIEDIQEEIEIDSVEVEVEEHNDKKDELEKPNLSNLSVKELKNLAKSLGSKKTYKELNALKKEELISLVDKFYREDE
ncbi:BMC domain-containing protein [Paraclostridium bifermentans]|uniref:BMC domain-containing protein n=1 Tax=Paraclostridium bifermentans TaxID=1490 RepID=UPI00038D1594|nr:BMC domain-containing protein [Paraclostridium bifermentans]EQK46733.1 BMC domain protein [[Clostridium] bifermentans ATCC 19299] [Paraclostridium bifermentans ATCC 19299]GKZ02576.1 bacterial microcompartment protein [Paraclostridium bifermentans]GKZ05958.1 bacterial microcompartment protein [Paraclostridium bifermentans]GKZ09015.1 bacterial microcompartment protein [Paraclostridium bifermentans]